MRSRSILLFVSLALIWGSAFLWIELALRDTSPWVISWLRLVLGALMVAGFTYAFAGPELRAQHAPARLREWIGPMFVFGFLMGAAPFTLLGFGQRHVSSGTASILMSTVPLWTVAIAATGIRATKDERVGLLGVLGLIVGFGGVFVLASGHAAGTSNDLVGDLLIMGTTFSYACGALYAREAAARGIPPLAGPLGVGLMGAILTLPGAIAVIPSDGLPSLASLGSIAALGLGCTGAAYIIYFELNRRMGAARSASVTYLIPVVGLVLGALALGESVGLAQLGGMALILAGVLVANGQMPGLRRSRVAGSGGQRDLGLRSEARARAQAPVAGDEAEA